MNSFLRAVNYASRVSAKAFTVCRFLAQNLGFSTKNGVLRRNNRFLRVPRGFNWRALELFFLGGGMSKTGSSRSAARE